MTKSSWRKHTANILSGERLKAFPLRLEIRQEWLFLLFLFKIVYKVIAKKIRQGKKTYGIQTGKRKVKLFVYRWHDIIEIENPNKSAKSYWI